VIKDRIIKLEGATHVPVTGHPGGLGDLHYSASFATQLRIVFGRTLTLYFRDKKRMVAETMQAVVKAVIIGIAFLDIGSSPPVNQLSFIFLLCQMSVVSLLQDMGALIENRTVMKFEVSDQLYRDEVFIISITIIDVTKFVLNYTIYLLIAFSMSGLEFSLFGSFYGWSLLALMAAGSYFQMMGSLGKTMADAQVKAMPFLILMMLFNGFFVTKATAASWMVWAIYVSPLFYFINQVSIASFSGTLEGQQLISSYQFVDMPTTSIAVLLSMIAVFRCLQVVFLKTCNNIQR